MTWASAILVLVKLIGALVGFLQERRIISGTEQKALADALQKQAEAIGAAAEAREDQRRRNSAVPGADSLPDDGFRRD